MATRSTEYGSSIDEAPLLPPQGDDRNSDSGSIGIGRAFRGTARTIRQASGRRLMREPSMRVRETATEQLEERRSDVAYSKPVVYLDMIWNFVFVTVACVVLVLSWKETPSTPLRLWILGYCLQCAVHMVCVCVEYRKRHGPRRLAGEVTDGSSSDGGQSVIRNVDANNGSGSDHEQNDENVSTVKNLESANTFFSFIWWIVGFYWISSGGQALVHNAPQLYWLCIIFLIFDVFFVVFCVALACVIGIAVCCCLPCIIAILYAVADQEGATEDDIRQLTKYKFRLKSDLDGGIMTECGTDTPYENTLSAEDAQCCICLSAYDDGAELCELPCSHHFHSNCVVKWLYINATCPLCKYNIIKNHGRQDV